MEPGNRRREFLSSRAGRANRVSPIAIAIALATAAILLIAAPGAGAQSILNQAGVNNGGVTQTTWLESFATVGESSSPANTMRISMIVQHPVGREVTGLRIDDDWDTSNEATSAAIKNVTAQQPNVSGGYGYSRITFSYVIPTSGTDMSCGTFSGTRRTDGNSVHVRARLDDGDETPTSSSRIKFIAAGNCQGLGGEQDFGSVRSWGSGNFTQQVTPGTEVNFQWVCDDPDTDILSSDDACGGIRWRRRNAMTGAVSATGTDCVDGDDNTTKNTPVTFPDRGRWIVEGELLEEDCDTSSGSYWFPIGAADVNSLSPPSISLSPSTTRPNTNANVTVTAALGADPDSGDGGHAEYVEWDTDDDGQFDDEVDRAGPTSAFGSNPTATVSTSSMSPGTHEVNARVTDNGAMGGADNIRRTSSTVSTSFTVNSPPTANGQTISTESNVPKAFTLTGTDANGDPLTFDIVGDPARGDICTTATGTCTEGTGANRFYRPDGNFAGTDTFTVRALDDHNGQSASTATVTVNVTPQTEITAKPDTTSGQATATFQFAACSPRTGPPAVSCASAPITVPPTASAPTFECRLDSALESEFQSCSSPRVYNGLSDGPHTFDVRARVGSFIDPTPATYTWTVDATFPDTLIDDGPDDPTSSGNASFDFHADDPGATFECRRDGDAPGGTGWESCGATGTGTKSYSGLTEGTHTFEVRATDHVDPQNPRTDPIPASYVWRIDQTAPEVTVDSGPNDPSNQPTAEFTFSSTDLTATFQCKLDTGSFTSCDSPESYGGLGDGPHTFTVKATDPAGNPGPEDTYTWNIDTGVPNTLPGAAPSNPDDSPVAVFGFSSNDLTAGFECRLDSNQASAWEECSSTQLYADLADGSHTFEVRAVDDAGNKDASPVQHTWSIDTSAPQTSVDSGPSGTTGATTAQLGFSADDLLATFECKLDGGPWVGGCTSLKQYTGLPQGTHTFRVRATDLLGNTDPTPATRTWTVDTTGPTVNFDAGPQNLTGSNSATIQFSANEAGSTFECRLDSPSGPFENCSSPVVLTNLSDTPHTLDVRATDGVGNPGSIFSRTWTVDTTAPGVAITTGMPLATGETTAHFEYNSNDGTAGFQCRLDGGDWQLCGTNGFGSEDYSGLDDGSHTFDVRARDSVGNVSAPDSDTWNVVDSDPPNVTIDSGPADPTVATTADFTFSSDEPLLGANGGSFQCKLDSQAFQACGNGMTGTRSYTGLALGTHTFTVLGHDGLGPDPSPAVWTWQVVTSLSSGGGGAAGVTARSPVITPGKSPLKRGRGTAATVSCPSGPCTVTGTAKLKIAGVSFTARVKATSPLASGSAANVTVVLPKAARAALAAAGKGVLKLQLAASSSGGNVSKNIKLKVTK